MKVMFLGRQATWKRLQHRAGIETRRVIKKISRFGKSPNNQATLIILGCQRSGTTMLSEVLARDPRSDVFPEKSSLSDPSQPGRLRLRPLHEVHDRLSLNRAELVVLKPLVESQRATEMLDILSQSSVVWMFRDYRDVVRSNLAMFGDNNGRDDLVKLLDHPEDWRGEGLNTEIRDLIRITATEPSEADAAALFWYARNSLFFEQNLDQDTRAWITPYEVFVTDPKAETEAIYSHAQVPITSHDNHYHVFSKSVGAGRDVPLSAPVTELCEDMMRRLKCVRDAQMNALNAKV